MSPVRALRTCMIAALLASAGTSLPAGTLSPGMEQALLYAGPDDLVEDLVEHVAGRREEAGPRGRSG